MKKLIILSVFILIFLASCTSEESETQVNLPEGTQKIEVVEHMNGGGYTFINGEENGKEIWVAVREMPVETGDVYYYRNAMEMKNFESKSLSKTFASIFFVNDISKNAGVESKSDQNTTMPGMISSSSGHSKPNVESKTDIKVEPLINGKTVEAIVNEKATLAGKTVKIRGIVTKYNGGIMNRNWLHIQDGTSSNETGDITVTSDQSAKVGETVIIEGTLALDKDFGAGYFYDIIVENATVQVEIEK